MSYILDALRKSERQRRLDNIPTLENPDRPAPRDFTGLGKGALVVLAAVAVAVLAVSAWWYTRPAPGDPRPGAAAPEPTATAFAGLGVEQTEARGTPAVRASLPAEESAAPVDAPAETAIAASAPPDAPVEPIPARAPTPYERLDADTRAQLPPLTVNAVSFSGDGLRRFVMINEGIYREGQQVSGVTVVHIRRHGVVLSHNGREFLMTP